MPRVGMVQEREKTRVLRKLWVVQKHEKTRVSRKLWMAQKHEKTHVSELGACQGRKTPIPVSGAFWGRAGGVPGAKTAESACVSEVTDGPKTVEYV